MNKTLKNILELCDKENLELTEFVCIPSVNGSTITIELQVDDRVKNCGGLPGTVNKVDL